MLLSTAEFQMELQWWWWRPRVIMWRFLGRISIGTVPSKDMLSPVCTDYFTYFEARKFHCFFLTLIHINQAMTFWWRVNFSFNFKTTVITVWSVTFFQIFTLLKIVHNIHLQHPVGHHLAIKPIKSHSKSIHSEIDSSI